MTIKNQTENSDQKPKLALRRETLRQLTDSMLQQVAGGSYYCSGSGGGGPGTM